MFASGTLAPTHLEEAESGRLVVVPGDSKLVTTKLLGAS
jgi:hypothetical protein